MSRQLEQQREVVQARRDKELVSAVEFELQGAIAHAGGKLKGLSVKFGEVDTLITLRADMPAGPMIAFVGAPNMSDCLRKAVSSAYRDDLRWKEDEWARS